MKQEEVNEKGKDKSIGGKLNGGGDGKDGGTGG